MHSSSSDWDAQSLKPYMAEEHQHNSRQSSGPQVYQCSASLQSGQFSLPAMLQSSRLPYVTSPWGQVLCYIMYLDGRFAILLLPSGFAEVQLAVLESEIVNCFDDDLRAGIRFCLFSCAA